MLKDLFKYLNSKTIERLVVISLVRLIESSQLNRVFDGIKIISSKEEDFDKFSTCVCDALHLLKTEFPIEYRIIKKNLKYILYIPVSDYLAMYLQSCCYIPWVNWKCYEESVRSRIMASSIVHAAYHGEYRKRFGIMAYFKSDHYARKCRNREVRILKRVKRNLDDNDKTYCNDRIIALETDDIKKSKGARGAWKRTVGIY